MKHFICIIALLASLLLTCIGCQDFDPVAEGVITSPKFDFATFHNVSIDVDYGELAAYAPISIYDEDPMREATAENQSPVGEPINSLVLGSDGRYNGMMRLPISAKHLYLYSPSMGAPMIMETNVIGGRASAKRATSLSYTRAQTRAEGGEVEPLGTYPGFKKIDPERIYKNDSGNGNYYTLNGDFDLHGKVKDVNGLWSEGNITAADISGIEKKLWLGGTTKPSKEALAPGNQDRFGVDNVNMFIDNEYVKDGTTYDVESAEVFVTFVGEYAWNENSFGYYFYKKGTTPNVNTLKKIIILPNASMGSHAPYSTYNSYAKFDNTLAPAEINTRYQLLYAKFDDNGEPTEVTKHFPPNTTIGFFLIVNGYGAYNNQQEKDVTTGKNVTKGVGLGGEPKMYGGYKCFPERTEGLIQLNTDKYYSNKEFNSGSEKRRYIAFSVNGKENEILYGIEDASDWSCDDFLFTLESTPALALKPENPNVEIQTFDPVQPTANNTTKTVNKTYAFEDIWPDGGDYDLSDVVVRHERIVTYNTKGFFVSKVVDKFTLVDDGMTEYKNAFAIVYPEAHHGTLTLPTGVVEETETGAIIITDDVRGKNGKSFTITRDFSTAVGLGAIDIEDINPFIINQSTGPAYTSNNRIEIHLPNHDVTSKGRRDTETASPWFISRAKRYPYALEIPGIDWVPCANGVRIGSRSGAYPQYNSWVESGGTQNADWYKSK